LIAKILVWEGKIKSEARSNSSKISVFTLASALPGNRRLEKLKKFDDLTAAYIEGNAAPQHLVFSHKRKIKNS
jgi:hypothetical protein